MNKPVQILLLAVATIAAAILLLPDPIGSGTAVGWVRIVLPIALSVGMFQNAYRAQLDGHPSTASALLRWATVAAGTIAIIAALGG